MNALAQVFSERHCCVCKRLKPLEAFAERQGRCRDCDRAYKSDRYARIKAGTWAPKTAAERSPRVVVERPPLTEVVTERPQPAPIPEAAEASLRLAIEAFMREFGFTALRVTYTRLEGEIAKKRRIDLAREGWIA